MMAPLSFCMSRKGDTLARPVQNGITFEEIRQQIPMPDIDVLLTENRKFPPSKEFAESSLVSSPDIYTKAAANPEEFWANQASQLEWFQPWSQVLQWDPPHAKWFIDGKLNVSVNCVDRHAKGDRKHAPAIIWEGEPGDSRTLTYATLHAEVNKFASALKSLGVHRGDRVAIYMPMIPEVAIAMLACSRIGAIHSVVFGGFSPESLRDRINDSECKVLITADGGFRRGGIVPLKKNSDVALAETPSIQKVVVVKRDHVAGPNSAGSKTRPRQRSSGSLHSSATAAP
jgi:acetyl-CoA synthetase